MENLEKFKWNFEINIKNIESVAGKVEVILKECKVRFLFKKFSVDKFKIVSMNSYELRLIFYLR